MTTTRPYTSHVADRAPGSGPVLAILTDGPTDMAVAAHAADLAARNCSLLIAVAAVHTSGLSINALLHRARARRVSAESRAIVARVTPILHAAGVVHHRGTLLLPAGVDALRDLPVAAVRQLVDRFSAAVVVTALPLRDPAGVLQPAPHPRHEPAARSTRTTAARSAAA